MMSRWMVGIERKVFVRPVRKEIDQLAFADQRLGDEQQHLRNAEAGETRAEQRARFVDGQPSVRGHNELLALAVEFPGVGPAGLRVAKLDAPVVLLAQRLRVCWPPV